MSETPVELEYARLPARGPVCRTPRQFVRVVVFYFLLALTLILFSLVSLGFMLDTL